MTAKKQFFRYMRAEHAISTLESGKLRVGRLRDLNDPFDCLPIVIGPPQKYMGRIQGHADLLKKWNDK